MVDICCVENRQLNISENLLTEGLLVVGQTSFYYHISYQSVPVYDNICKDREGLNFHTNPDAT